MPVSVDDELDTDPELRVKLPRVATPKATLPQIGKQGYTVCHVAFHIERIRADRNIVPSFNTFYEYMRDDYRRALAERCLLYTSNRLGVNARLLEHGEETVVFLLAETDGVSEHRLIDFGISPAFVSFFFTHITLDLAV